MKMNTRQLEIIRAAGELLTTYGVAGLTTKKLAMKVGFSESALYRHFTGKEEIILTMLHYLAENIETRLKEAVKEHAGPEEKLTRVFREQFMFFKKNPHYAVVVFSDALLEEKEEVNNSILTIIALFKNYLQPLIHEGQIKGIFTDIIPADKMIHILIGSIRLLMFQWRLSDFGFNIEKEGEKVMASIFLLIKNKNQ